MPVDSFVKAEAEGQGFGAANAAQATLIQGTWLHTEEQHAMLQHQQLQQHQSGLLQANYPAAVDAGGLMSHTHQETAVMAAAAAAVQHPTDLAGHPADMMGTAANLQHMHGTPVDVSLLDANPDMIVEAAAGELMSHLHGEQMHQDVIMQQACMTAHTGNASNGQLMMQQQQEQGAWVAQPAQSNSVSSSVGADSNPREHHQQGQSGLRNSGTHAGSNAGNRKGARKPHLQGRFSGRLATKDDEKKLNQECRLLGPLLGGVGKRGDGSRLTLAKIVRGIAAGEVRKFCEERERIIKVLKQRVSHLETAAQQADVARQENVILRQKLMDMETLVRDGRSIPQQGTRDIHMAAAAGAAQLVDTPMPQAVMEMAAGPGAAPAGVAGVPLMLDATQTGGSLLSLQASLQPNGNHPGALAAGSMQCNSGSGQGQQPLAAAGGSAGLRSLDSFTSTAATDAPNAGMAHLAVAAIGVPPPAAALAAAAPIAVGVHPNATTSVVQGLGQGPHPGAAAAGGTATTLQTLSGRDGSMDGSGMASLLPPGAPSAAIPIPARVRAVVADPVAMGGAAGSLGASPGIGPSPGLGPSPGISTLSGTLEDPGAIQQPGSATAAAAAAAAGIPHAPSVSLGIPVSMIAGSQPMAATQGMGAISGANAIPAVAADPVTATTAVAAQVAQAAQAVQQQAASLHAAAEVHAQKAHAATSQVQSLQATAQVIAKTHEELVKKIEDVKQTAVAQIQQPVPTVPPEEVVKHAQIEVQKLEAQAQAQAIAAVQVSAAAQRAEAEAQKHLVVHAQVAAQAQQLQAKAVHLQVHADQLSNSAVAAEAAVVTAAVNAGVDMARVASSTSGPLATPGVGLGAPAVGLPAASSVGAPLMTSVAVNPLAAQSGQQLGDLPSSMAMTSLPPGPVVSGIPSLAPPALAAQAPPPTAAPVLMGSASVHQQQQLVAAGVPVEGLPHAGVVAQGLVQTSPTLLPSTVVTTQISTGAQIGSGHTALASTGAAAAMPVASQALQPAALAAPASSHVVMGQAATGVDAMAAGMPMHMAPAAAPAASTLSGMQQQQQPPMQQQPAASMTSAGQVPGGSLVHSASTQSQQQAAIEAAVAAQQAAQQAAKMEAANAAAAAAAMQQQATQAQMEHAAAAAAAAQHAANMHAQQAAQLQADHAAASAAAAAAAAASAQQQMVAFNAAMQADAAAAAVGMHPPVMQDMMHTQHLQQQPLTQPAGVASVHNQAQQQANMMQQQQQQQAGAASAAAAGRPPLPPGAMPRDGSIVMSNAVGAPQGSTGSGGIAYATAAEAQQHQQQQLAMMQRMGSGSSQHGMEPSITGGVGGGMPRVESINSIQAMMNSQQQPQASAEAAMMRQQQAAMQQQAVMQQQAALQQQQQAASMDLMQQQATTMQQDLMQQQSAAVQQDMMQQQALQQQQHQQQQQVAQQQAMQQHMMQQQAMSAQQVSMQPDVMQHDHMASTLLPQQQQQPLAAVGSGSVMPSMIPADLAGVGGTPSHMVGGAAGGAAMLPSPPNPQQDMLALQQQQLQQQPSPFQHHTPASINSPALQDSGLGVAAGGNGSSLGHHPSGSNPAPGSYLVSSPQVDSLLTTPGGANAALVTPSAAGSLVEKHDPIAQQLQSRGGVDASALDLEVLPQLDPASVEYMIDAPTPGGTLNMLSVIHDTPGALSQGLEGL